MIKLNSTFIKMPDKKILLGNILHNRGKTLYIYQLYYPFPSSFSNTYRSFNYKILSENKSLPEVENFYDDNAVYYLVDSPNIYKFNSLIDTAQAAINSSISGKYNQIDKINKKIYIYDDVNLSYYIYDISGNILQTINLNVDSTTELMPTGHPNIIIKRVWDTTASMFNYSIVDDNLVQTSANILSFPDYIKFIYPTINKNNNIVFIDETSVQEYDLNLNLLNKYDFTTNIINPLYINFYIRHLYGSIYAIFEKDGTDNTFNLKIVDVSALTILYEPTNKYYNVDVIYDANINNNIHILSSYYDLNNQNYVIKYVQLDSNDFSIITDKIVLENNSNYINLTFAYDNEDVIINHSEESILYYQNELFFTINYNVDFIINKNDLLFFDIYTPVITDITANISTDSTILIDFRLIGDVVYSDNTISKTYTILPPGETLILPIKVYYPGNIKINYIIKTFI